MNVGELKKALEDIPNSVEILVKSYENQVVMAVRPSAPTEAHVPHRVRWTVEGHAEIISYKE